MSLLIDGRFPPLQAATTSTVSVEDRITAIDFVNRVNLLFEEFDPENDYERIVSSFTEHSTVVRFTMYTREGVAVC